MRLSHAILLSPAIAGRLSFIQATHERFANLLATATDNIKVGQETVMFVRTSLPASAETSDADSLFRRVALRFMPLLFVGYVVAYLDRVNVGFAKLQMLNALHLSEAVYGLGAGLFFVGYFFFEVPSNLLLHRIGARRWIARIMATWGVLSIATAFVQTPVMFYVMRFCLGIAEAGFFPGMVLYLTYWFPSHRRGKMIALLMAGNPVSGIFGGPLSGHALLSMIGLTLAASGVVTALPMFWALPTAFLGGTGAAAGIALINSTGNLAGFVSPALVGWLKTATHSLDSSLFLIAGCLIISACLILTQLPARLVNR